MSTLSTEVTTSNLSPFILPGVYLVKEGNKVVGIGQINETVSLLSSDVLLPAGITEQWVFGKGPAVRLSFSAPYAALHEPGKTYRTLYERVGRLPWPTSGTTTGAEPLVTLVKVDAITSFDVEKFVPAVVGAIPGPSYTRDDFCYVLGGASAYQADAYELVGDEVLDTSDAPRLWMEVLKVGEDPIGFAYGEWPVAAPNGVDWKRKLRITQVWCTSAARPAWPKPETVATGAPANSAPDSRDAWFTAARDFNYNAVSPLVLLASRSVRQYDILPVTFPTD